MPSMTDGPYRVLVVDDSAVIRGLLCRVLESDPDITVAATVGNGEMALRALPRHQIDIVILDIEMPVMDGLAALPKILEAAPGVQVIMASTLTARNADISLQALRLGAADYIPKPSSTGDIAHGYDFKSELLGKVKALAAARRGGPAPSAAPQGGTGSGRARPAADATVPTDGDISLRPAPRVRPDILGIGASTGGPQALLSLLPALDEAVTQPIVITQHMPATFTTILAGHLQRLSGRPCAEGVDGAPLLDGHIYVAPGGYHMTVEARSEGKFIRLNQNPPENFCRPSADPMFRSLAQAYGTYVLAVVLTGMGHDGLMGGEAVVNAGGAVIAQDEASSVVWGMPGAVARAGLCSAVLPLAEIGAYVRKLALRPAA